MTLDIFSFQRAFSAKKKMALAAGNCYNSAAAIESKDILDSLYLGLDCEIADCGEFCDASSTVDEFIDNCKNLLQQLSNVESNQVTIQLSNNDNLSLNENSGSIQMKLDGEYVVISDLTIPHLYENLMQDIQSNPDLYGSCLASYVNNLEQRVLVPASLVHS